MIYKNRLNEILQEHKNVNSYYIEASKIEKCEGIVIINEEFTTRFKLPESCSFT